jgi:glycosyltransferase involved in cell wall biosynthesis
MRIAVLSRTFFSPVPGGMERHAAWLAESLRGAGHQVTVIAARPQGIAGGALDPGAVAVDAPGDRWSSRWNRETEAQIRAFRPDVVAAESTAANHLTREWPVVTHLHGNHWNELYGAWVTWGRGRTRTAIRRSAELAVDYLRWKPWQIAGGYVIALTEREARLARALYRVPTGRLTVVGNPVSPVFNHTSAEKQRMIAFAGRLDPAKGAERVLRAFAASGVHSSGYQLHVAGDGPERGRLCDLAARLGISDYISFRGLLEREALARLLAESEIACFPSLRRESFSIGVLEAMASRCAVAASLSAGVCDIVGHPMVMGLPGEAARVVRQPTTSAWAEALTQLTACSAERMTLSEAGFAVSQSFTEAEVLRRILLTYDAAHRGTVVPAEIRAVRP